MLHYSVDHELMSDLYRDYRQIKGAEYEQIHALGEHYLAIAQDYDLARQYDEVYSGTDPVSDSGRAGRRGDRNCSWLSRQQRRL